MIRYTITEEEYLEMARSMFTEQRGTKKTAVLKLLLKTVIQMGVAAFLILYYPEARPWLKWTVGILSVLWAALSLFRYFFVDLRANMLLNQSKSNPKNADFWKEHHLDEEGQDDLRLAYGDARLELPYSDVTDVKETDSLFLIYREKYMFELVPKRALGSGQQGSFREMILEKRDRAMRSRLDELKQSITEDAVFVRRLDLSRDELAAANVKMKRASFLNPAGWSLSMAISLLFPLGLAVYCAINGGWLYCALCMATFILFNMRYLIIFMPAYDAIVREQIPEPPEGGYLLAMKDKTIWLITAYKAFSYPLDKLKKTVSSEDGLYLYFDKQIMLFIPASAADAYLRAVGQKKSLHERVALAASYGEAEDAENAPAEIPDAPAVEQEEKAEN